MKYAKKDFKKDLSMLPVARIIINTPVKESRFLHPIVSGVSALHVRIGRNQSNKRRVFCSNSWLQMVAFTLDFLQ